METILNLMEDAFTCSNLVLDGDLEAREICEQILAEELALDDQEGNVG